MAFVLTVGSSVSLGIKLLDCQASDKTIAEQSETLYRPGDIIPAMIEVHKHRSFEALTLHASLVGETRVWTHPVDREDIYETMIHTHLDQSMGFSQSLTSIDMTSAGSTMSIPATFVLPEFTAGSGGKQSSSSSRMPPSFESGLLYLDPWGRSYKQPLIEYYLQATLQYRAANETVMRTISAKHRIRITTAPHSDPPTYFEKAPEPESITASADIRRSKFSKPFAKLGLAMAEPLPVVARGASGCCKAAGQLHLTWETSSQAYDEFELGKRRVELEYELQARTRYRTRVVQDNEISGDNKTTSYERLNSTHLGTFVVRATDRHNVRLAASRKQWRGHTGTIPIPVQIAEGTVPTFSHVLTSRAYTLVVKVRLQGLQHKALSVKVPLQVCETSAAHGDDRSRATFEMYAKMALSEVLPRYEDHQYSPSL